MKITICRNNMIDLLSIIGEKTRKYEKVFKMEQYKYQNNYLRIKK